MKIERGTGCTKCKNLEENCKKQLLKLVDFNETKKSRRYS